MHKFKVGDKIRMKTQEGTLYTYYDFPESVTIASICEDNYRYVAEDSSGFSQVVHEYDIELTSEVTYEDQWHLNDGVTPIPEDADTLEKDGSVVAYRKVKTPNIATDTLILEFDPYDNTFGDVGGCIEGPLGTVEFTLTFTDGKITDIKTKILGVTHD